MEAQIANEFRARLLNGELEKVRDQHGSCEFIFQLYVFVNALTFYPNTEIKKKLKEYGLDIDRYSFLVSISEIENQLNIIEKAGIQINKALLILGIKIHLGILAAHYILIDFMPVRKEGTAPISLLQENFHQFLRSRKRSVSGGELVKGKNAMIKAKFEELVNECTLIYTGFGNNTPAVMMQLINGKTESTLLRGILEDCFLYEKTTMSKNKFYNVVYQLFALVSPQLRDRSEDRYYYSASKSSNSAFYAKRLHKFIYKNY